MNRVLRLCIPWRSRGVSTRSSLCQSTSKQPADQTLKESFPLQPEFDWDYLTDPDNIKVIDHNIASRKGVGNPQLVCDLFKKWLASGKTDSKLEKQLLQAAADIPNQSHPMSPMGPKEREIKVVGRKLERKSSLKSIGQLGDYLQILRTENMGHSSGHKSYYFIDALASLESALVQYTVDTLDKKGFTLVSCPNIVHPSVVEGCGFRLSSEDNRTQVYSLDPALHGDACLAGTGEIPLAGLYMNRILEEHELPHMLAAVSHCYRAEAPNADTEKDLYRVHQFTKVEMFGVCGAEEGCSDELLHSFLHVQQQLFEPLGIHFRVLDMPRPELGAPAYRKYDMEAWMPAKQFWGEISSASNCTDFQSRRFNIKYKTRGGEVKHAHTVNGTACAVPRLLISLLETHQQDDDGCGIPDVLQPYMPPSSQSHIYRTPSNLANIRWMRSFSKLRTKKR